MKFLEKLIIRIKCKIFYHRLSIIDVSLTGNVEKVKCLRCGKSFGMNHDVKAFIRWDNGCEQCFASINERHSKGWPENRKWLDEESDVK